MIHEFNEAKVDSKEMVQNWTLYVKHPGPESSTAVRHRVHSESDWRWSGVNFVVQGPLTQLRYQRNVCRCHTNLNSW